MTGVKASWELAESVDQADPFSAVVYSTGIEIDLSASEDDLFRLLKRLMYREARLFDKGLTCGLKDGGQNCLHCPAASLDETDPKSVLCRLGKDEQTVADGCHAARKAAVAELVAFADEASEMGDVPDELVELLTEVGP